MKVLAMVPLDILSNEKIQFVYKTVFSSNFTLPEVVFKVLPGKN